jgi:hypothetical protein
MKKYHVFTGLNTKQLIDEAEGGQGGYRGNVNLGKGVINKPSPEDREQKATSPEDDFMYPGSPEFF